MDIVESLEMRYRLCWSSMGRESHISRNELPESLKMPRELMERFTNITDLNLGLRSETRRAYFKLFLSSLQFRLVSNPIVSSKT